MLDDKDLEKIFLELIGEAETKPFDCIGTIDEVKYALNRIIDDGDTSYLVNLYKDNYYQDIDMDIHRLYYDNNVPDDFLKVLKKSL